ncbi:FkbM family methyltransferase [Methylomonas sp. MED-D]|uniref:FkbM family methyltransferase n=1 Tax=unclassified Methylomonas TaxID=2608980 RepID=UPI0028A371EB|nr:FkbM family methyltransferase [Methylomonas sp. MV1]MDT4328985.1 FkbM family methyltransferase [Methylomonas sp. MV1]
MVFSDKFTESISESQLRALYALLPDVLRENIYASMFSKHLQRWRETLHPHGKVDVRELDGFDAMTIRVNLGDRLGCDIYYGFVQEIWDYSLFMAILNPEDIVVDIGANFGMYTLGAAKRLGDAGRVYAFEPDERSMSLLKENLQLNALEERVTRIGACVGSYDGEVKFYAAANPSFSGIFDTNRSETAEILNLPIRRLDSVMREHGVDRIDKVKIDVEGAEYEVLDGASETLAHSDAIIMLEISNKNLDDQRTTRLSEMLKAMNDNGYGAVHINQDNVLAQLIFDESLSQVVRRTLDGQTRNYFLLKRDTIQMEIIRQAFKQLNTESMSSLRNGGFRFDSSNKHVVARSELLVRDGNELDDINAALWAERIDKHIALDFNRKIISRNRALQTKLDELNKEMKLRLQELANLSSRLAQVNGELELQEIKVDAVTGKRTEISKQSEEQIEDTSLIRAKFSEATEALIAKQAENANFKIKLTETSRKLKDQKASNVTLKEKLAKTTDKLASCQAEKKALKEKLDETSFK